MRSAWDVWIERLLPATRTSHLDDEETRRRLVLAAACLLGVPMLLYYSVATWFSGLERLALLCLLTAGTLFVTWLRVRAGGGRWTARFALVVVIALLATSLLVAERQFSVVWVVALPPLLIFFFGRREGAFWALGILLAFLLILLRPTAFGVPADASYWPPRGAIEDFAFAYAAVTLFAIAFEVLRRGALERLGRALAEREESEARARDFALIGTDLLFELGPDLRVTFLSGGWKELTGIPEEAVLGLRFAENAPGYTRSGWEDVAARLEARETVRDVPVKFHMEDGRDLTVLVRAVPRFGGGGRFLGYRGVGVDQTARMQTEQELRAKDRALQHASRMEAVGQLTSGVAHDFNNLLTVILGNLELLGMRLEAQGADSEEVDQATMAARRAADLTSKLLAFARRQALHPVTIDVGELLLEAQDLFQRTLPENIEVRLHVASTAPHCHADRTQLETALLNLALNARDAMPNGGALLLAAERETIDAQEAERLDVEAGTYVRIRARDTGTGMPAELLEHVFEPFFTTKPTGRGTGLGLSMVYGFVRQSGGTVRIETAQGLGTTIDMLLPGTVGAEAVEALPPRHEDHSGHGHRVLLVEDEASVRGLVTMLLERLGYEVEGVPGGAEALAAFRDHGCDLLLSDVVLAGSMSGIELIRAIHDEAPETPAMLMSGYSDALFRAGDGGLPGVPLIAKPFGLGQLREALGSLLPNR